MNGKQHALMSAIDEYWRAHGYAPSVRELVAACGLSSTAVCRHNLRALREDGWIDFTDGIPRTVRVLKRPRGSLVGNRGRRRNANYQTICKVDGCGKLRDPRYSQALCTKHIHEYLTEKQRKYREAQKAETR
jgi:SOS-response transcriptional repressor LexA